MFWKRKVPQPKHDTLSPFEQKLIKIVAQALTRENRDKLIAQINYIKLINRIKYSKDFAIELYPEKLADLPGDILFEKKDDFKLCTVNIELENKRFTIKYYMVLGLLFEMRISPIIDSKKVTLSENNVKISKIDLTKEFIQD